MTDAKKTASKKTDSKAEANRTDSPTPGEVKEAMAERATGGTRSEEGEPFPTTADLNPAFTLREDPAETSSDDDDSK